MVQIPESMMQKYRAIADDFIDSNFGVNCTLYYPPTRVECSECTEGSIANADSNRFSHGGPNFSSQTSCVHCGGNGYKEEPTEDIIKLRVYFSHKDFISIGNHQINDGTIQVIGKMSDVQKFERADKIKIVTENLESTAVKAGKTQPHGFEDRYFVSFMEL